MIWSKSAPSQLEFRRLTVDNTTTGEAIKDDPQGQGAGFAIGIHTTLVLTDSVFLNNICGEKVSILLSLSLVGSRVGVAVLNLRRPFSVCEKTASPLSSLFVSS